MSDAVEKFELVLELPRDALGVERALASDDYTLGEPTELAADPDLMEANFIDPITLIAVMTLALLAERVLHFALAKNGQGVLIDTRTKPPRVSALAGVPQGFVVIVKANGTTETVRADQTPNELSKLIGAALKLKG